MESKNSSCSGSAQQEASNYDELLMRNSLLFADNLKELKNLRKQLYSAAEYFELSYCKEDQKQLVVETVKDYITNAIVSTVDHLGSVACKVTNFLDEKVDEFSGAELHFSCIEQKIRACQEFSGRSGVARHSFLIKAPKYHKKYEIPAVQATRVEPHSPSFRKRHPSLPPSSPGTFSFAKIVSNHELERTDSSPPCFQLKRSGTFVRNSIIPNSSNAKWPYPVELRRSVTVSSHAERNMTKEIQQYSKKSKPLFKALFTMLKQKRDGKPKRINGP